MTIGSWDDAAVSDPAARGSVVSLLKGLITVLTGGSVSTKDAGPSQTVTRTYTASADMTTAAAISAAPTSGQKLVGMDFIISSDTAMSFSIQEETSATVFAKVFLPANGAVQITPRGFVKTAVADKKFFGKASAAGNVAVTAIYFSEA